MASSTFNPKAADTTTPANGGYAYNMSGGAWRAPYGGTIQTGRTGDGTVYRAWIAFNISSLGSNTVLGSSTLTFNRSDTYSNTVYWDVGLRSSAPPQNFSTSDFTKQIADDFAVGKGNSSITISAADLTPFKTGTVYVCFRGRNDSSYNYGEIATSSNLPSLVVNYTYAKSTLSVSNGTFQVAQTLTVTRQNSSYTHTITASCAGVSETIVTKGTSTSISWTPSLSRYGSAIPNATSASCTLTITTYDGNTSLGSNSYTITLSMRAADITPTVSLSVVDGNGYESTYGGYIVGKSTYKVTATPSLKYGATLASTKITANGSTYTTSPATTSVITSTSQTGISATITDSRGKTASASATKTVLAYNSPAINTFTVHRSDQDGSDNSQGAYCRVDYDVSITSLNNHNTRTLKLYYKKSSVSSYSDPVTITTASGNYIFAADTDSSYDIKLALSDNFSTTTRTLALSTAATVMDIYHDGTGVAFGKVAENGNLLDIAWPIKVQDVGVPSLEQAVFGVPAGMANATVSDLNDAPYGVSRWDTASANKPPNGNYGVLMTYGTNAGANNSWTIQIATSTDSPPFVYGRERTIFDGVATWTGWTNIGLRNPLPVNQGGTGSNTAPLIVRSFSTSYTQIAAGSSAAFDESFITVPTGYSKVGVVGVTTNASGVYPRSFLLRNNQYSFELQNTNNYAASVQMTVYILFGKSGFVG